MPEQSDRSMVIIDGETYGLDEVKFDYEAEEEFLENLSFELRNYPEVDVKLEEELSSKDYSSLENWLTEKVGGFREGREYSASNNPVLFIYGLGNSIGTPHIVINELEDVEKRLSPVSEN